MNKTKILLYQAIPGMIVASDIFTKDGNLIISANTPLTDKIITRLEFYSIIELTVYRVSSAQDIDTELKEETYNEKIKKSESFLRFQKAYENTRDEFKTSLDQIVTERKPIDTDKLLSEAGAILTHCESHTELLNMLHCMRNFDDTTYLHSLNVALICNIIGRWLHFKPEDLEVLTLSGLLHDVGKLMIPSDILLKPAKLTAEEYATAKTHTVLGYHLMKEQPIDIRIKHSALMHHERCDGSGYPLGMPGSKIEDFAKLVAIADVYDAMTSARIYRGPLCPFEVLAVFETEGLSKFDTKYVMTFMEGIAQTYVNNTVRLSNDMVGEVVMINKNELSRPIVKVNDQFLDLSRKRDLTITAIL